MDSELDQGHGSLLLLKPENAEIVEACLLRHHGIHYALAAWCVMPNHVHVVVEPFDTPLDQIVQPWKSLSAHAINKREKRRASLWQREYFDRFMRDAQQFENTVAYVENNPVAAGLVELALRWRFSSAWLERNAGEGAGAPEVH